MIYQIKIGCRAICSFYYKVEKYLEKVFEEHIAATVIFKKTPNSHSGNRVIRSRNPAAMKRVVAMTTQAREGEVGHATERNENHDIGVQSEKMAVIDVVGHN